ncbi:MGA_1079 family surface serine endopeptidase [Mycoplasmopsis gallinacea]|uniref:Lipoprotein-associated type-17 domain-containing protein n=1 Tax=Mycoplasmopsis gallinacea TaxID=29556 RepID=A0A6H0V3J8_9BACT|nr:lipoprotein 17-related variable surface protein [Mycoplasmopsis gallinacea]QIW62304.1 hypothetical protein GOQ20_02590 [Mycoplasmopsis gallinacea]
MNKNKKILIVSAATGAAGVIGLTTGLFFGLRKKQAPENKSENNPFENLSISFDYPNKENTLTSQALVEKVMATISNNTLGAKLAYLGISDIADDFITLSYQVAIGKEISKKLTAEINGFLNPNYVENLRLKIANATVNFDYINKETTELDQASTSAIVYQTNEPQLVVKDIAIQNKDFQNNTLIITYSLTVNDPGFANELLVENKIATISGFDSANFVSDQDKENEKSRLNNLVVNASIINSKIIPSQIDIDNYQNYLTLNLNDSSAMIQVQNILGYDNYLGLIKLEYILVSTDPKYSDIHSEIKTIIVGNNENHFKTEQERINELIINLTRNVSLIKTKESVNKNQTKASSIALNDLIINESFLQNQLAVIWNLKIIKANDENGTLELSYKIKSTQNNLDTITNKNLEVISENSNTLTLSNFLTNEKEALNNEFHVAISASSTLLANKASLVNDVNNLTWSITSASNNWSIIPESKNIVNKDDVNGHLTLSYSVKNNLTNQNIVNLTYVIEGFLTEQERLNNLLNSLSNDQLLNIKNSSLNKLPSEITNSDFEPINSSSLKYNVKVENIEQIDDNNGLVAVKVYLYSTEANLTQIHSSNFKIIQFNNLSSIEVRETQRLEAIKNKLVLDYANKGNIIPISQNINPNKISFKTSDNLNLLDLKVQVIPNSIHIYDFNDVLGKIKVSYILKSLNYNNISIRINESISDSLFNTISGFKTELQRINQINNLGFLYTDSSNILPSEANLTLVSLNQDFGVKLAGVQATNIDDQNGILSFKYKLRSSKYPDIVEQNFRNASLSFQTLSQRKEIEKARLNSLIANLNVAKTFVVQNQNKSKENTKASMIIKEDLLGHIDANEFANIKILRAQNANDENGTVEIVYQLVSTKDNLTDVESNSNTFVLSGFLVNTESDNKEEKARIDSLDLTIDYQNKDTVFASESEQNNYFIVSNNSQVALINVNVIQVNDVLGWAKIHYNLRSTKASFTNSNIVSDTKEFIIYNFKNGLTPDEIKMSDKNEVNALNPTYEYSNKANISADSAIASQIHFAPLPNNSVITDLKITSFDNIERSIHFEYRVAKHSYKSQLVASELKRGIITGFAPKELTSEQEAIKNQLDTSFVPNFKADLANNPNIRVYAMSLNKENAKYYLDLNAPNGITLEVKDVLVDKDNLNQAKVTMRVAKGNISFDYQRVFISKNDIKSVVNKINYSNLDQLFDINYSLLKSLPNAKMLENEKIRNLIFAPKLDKISGFFDYELDLNSLTNEITQVNKSVPINQNDVRAIQEMPTYVIKLKANVKIKFNNQEIKVLKNLSPTKQSNQRDWQNKENISTYFGKAAYNITYKPSAYYQNQPIFNDPSSSRLLDYFKAQAEDIASNNSEYQGIDFDKIQANDPKKHKLFKEIILRNFDFNFDGWTFEGFYDLVPEKDGNKFYIFTDINDPLKGTTSLRFILKLKKDNQEIMFPFHWDSNQIPTSANELLLYNIIENNRISELFKLTEVKSEKTHSDYLASEAWNIFESVYTLPSFGEFAIHLVPENERDSKTREYDNLLGKSYLQFGLYKNGVFQKCHKTVVYTLEGSRLLNRDDFNPTHKEWFDQSDFLGQDYETPSSEIISKINQINSTDFEYNLTRDSKRLIDPKLITDQKAFDKLNYLLKFKSPSSINNVDPNNIIVHPSISNPNDNETSVDIETDLKNDYFIYYFDVQSNYSASEKGTLSFKLGFINKANPKIRYATPNRIYLKNLVNDYALYVYREAIINTITFDNLSINETLKSNLIRDEFINKVKNSSLDQNFVSVQNLSYNSKNLVEIFGNTGSFKFVNPIKVNSLPNSVLVQLAYSPSSFTNKNDTIKTDAWFEISNFRDATNTNSNPNYAEILNQISAQYGMKKVFLTNNKTLRRRRIELNYKDVFFNLDKQNNIVTWTFKKQYYQKLLERQNQEKAKINFHFNTNIAYLDSNAFSRVFKNDKGINVSLDWNELKSKKITQINGTTETVNNKVINYKLTFNLTDEGIDFRYEIIGNNDYKIVGNNVLETLQANSNAPFDNSKAVYFNLSYGATVTIDYLNNINQEVFKEDKTNWFDYKNMSFTNENVPLIIYNKDYNKGAMFEYDPNQNLPYKFHEGYKLDIEYMHYHYEDSRVKDLYNRASLIYLTGAQGTGLFVGKANSDTSDGKMFAITNNHVINNDSTVQDPTQNTRIPQVDLGIATNKYKNSVDNGYDPKDQLYSVPVKIFPFWTGRNQISEDKSDNNKYVDITFYLVDINQIIDKLIEKGRFQTALWYKKLLSLPNLNFNNYNKDNLWYSSQKIKEMSNWETYPEYYTGRLFAGYPDKKLSGYIVNRNTIHDNREIFGLKNDRTKNFTPVFVRGGQSGTGVIDGNGTYISTINSAVGWFSLTSWFGYSSIYSNGKTQEFNYFGIPNPNQDILSIPNINSAASNVMKLNAWDPSIGIPFWIVNPKEFNKK